MNEIDQSKFPGRNAELEPWLQRAALDDDMKIGLLLRRAYQFNLNQFQRRCPDRKLTSVQLSVLYALNDGQPLSLTDIGRAASIDPSTTRGVVDRLLSRHLLTVEQDVEDRRRTLATITQAGLQLTKDMFPIVVEVAQDTLQGFNPAERVALNLLLSRMGAAEE
jgi:DNA-binding MarR family transcriptional regulator